MAVNPILAALNKQAPQQPQQAYNVNPMSLLNTPQAQQNAINTINSYGGDGRKAFFGECQKRGIDPNQALEKAQMLFKQMFPNK